MWDKDTSTKFDRGIAWGLIMMFFLFELFVVFYLL